MALTTENFTGADATGNDGDSNRTITLSNTEITQSAWFSVFVSGLGISLTTDYTVSHNSSSSVITFLNALFDDTPIIVNYQTGATDDINSLYCSSDQVAAFLQVPAFSVSTTPTKTEVDSPDSPGGAERLRGFYRIPRTSVPESTQYLLQTRGEAWPHCRGGRPPDG